MYKIQHMLIIKSNTGLIEYIFRELILSHLSRPGMMRLWKCFLYVFFFIQDDSWTALLYFRCVLFRCLVFMAVIEMSAQVLVVSLYFLHILQESLNILSGNWNWIGKKKPLIVEFLDFQDEVNRYQIWKVIQVMRSDLIFSYNNCNFGKAECMTAKVWSENILTVWN